MQVTGQLLEIKMYGVNDQTYDPVKLINYRSGSLVKEVELWDPARGQHITTLTDQIDITSSSDPAKYNTSINTTTNPLYYPYRSWASENVGKMWWDTSNLGYKSYFDPSIITDLDTRLATWGDLADYASVDVYQWVESPVLPTDYVTFVASTSNVQGLTGVPAKLNTYFKYRTWQTRPVAWATQPLNGSKPSLQPGNLSALFITPNALILDVGSWNSYSLTNNTSKISGVICSPDQSAINIANNLDSTIIKPFGEAMVTDNTPYYVVGSSTVPQGAPTALTNFILSSTISDTDLGSYAFSTDGTNLIVTNTLTTVAQTLAIPTVTPQTILNFTASAFSFSYAVTSSLSLAALFAVEFVIRSAITSTINIAFGTSSLPAGNYNGSSQYTSWVSYDDPDKLATISDGTYPNNVYQPIYGDWVLATDVSSTYTFGDQSIQKFSAAQIAFITAGQTGWTLPDSSTVTKSKFTWSDWNSVLDKTETLFVTAQGSQSVADFSAELLYTGIVRIFTNGFETKKFTNTDGVIQIVALPSRTAIDDIVVGDQVVIKYYSYRPTTVQLNAGESIPITESIAYFEECDYTTISTLNQNTGSISNTLYYFWVKNTGSTYSYKTSTTLNIQNSLMNTTGETFACLSSSTRDNRLDIFSIYNLKNYVAVDNEFKIQFLKDFSLRDQSDDLKLKNFHEEWVLQYPTQPTSIKKQFWDVLVNSAVGTDILGHPLPKPELIAYDAQHGTSNKYGFKPGQIMNDSSEIISIIQSIISVDNYHLSEDPLTNYGYDVLSYNKYFSADSLRTTLNTVYSKAKPSITNAIFFAVLLDALSKNVEYADVIKTSYLAVNASSSITIY
jgi:hypothetical protein